MVVLVYCPAAQPKLPFQVIQVIFHSLPPAAPSEDGDSMAAFVSFATTVL